MFDGLKVHINNAMILAISVLTNIFGNIYNNIIDNKNVLELDINLYQYIEYLPDKKEVIKDIISGVCSTPVVTLTALITLTAFKFILKRYNKRYAKNKILKKNNYIKKIKGKQIDLDSILIENKEVKTEIEREQIVN